MIQPGTATQPGSAMPPGTAMPPGIAPQLPPGGVVPFVPKGPSRGWARDTALVARFELGEALRTRLLVVMLFLFVGAGALAAWGFSEMIEGIEHRTAEITGAPTTRRPGGALRRMRESASYRDLLRTFLRDEKKADYYAAQQPIVVFFGWAAMLFTPWLLLFTAADTIASEVSSRAIRYVALRTSRLSYALGKLTGQVVIMLGVTALSAVAFYLVAWASFEGFEHGATALGLASYWPRVVIFSLPFVGWSMFASMATASANMARIVALGGAVVLAILNGLAARNAWVRGDGATSNAIWDLVTYLTPFGHREGLAYPPGGAMPTDIILCVALTVVYFCAGFAILERRDI